MRSLFSEKDSSCTHSVQAINESTPGFVAKLLSMKEKVYI